MIRFFSWEIRGWVLTNSNVTWSLAEPSLIGPLAQFHADYRPPPTRNCDFRSCQLYPFRLFTLPFSIAPSPQPHRVLSIHPSIARAGVFVGPTPTLPSPPLLGPWSDRGGGCLSGWMSTASRHPGMTNIPGETYRRGVSPAPYATATTWN